ncbi:small ribosomal subunit protein mS40-like [Tubulanus polymorphus]|uniref:small ribosomal subunit protein mS40-like n=1 Tax=Tubulanus polymorphus TaxID=672921 RepID=UPI003DA414DE
MRNRHFSVANRRYNEAEETEESSNADDQTPINPRPNHSLETSQRYLASTAYSEVYGDEPVWTKYKRNFKGQYQPKKTRKQCINVNLLKQFIDPHSGLELSPLKTGVCRKQLMNLQIAIEQAYDYGYLDMPLPFKRFDYADYYPQLKQQQKPSNSSS